MSMKNALLERRVIEAETLLRVYRRLLKDMPQDKALEIIRGVLEDTATEAGQAFAARAKDEPNFEHFKSIVSVWRSGGALEIEDVEDTPSSLRFDVTRCFYVEKYRELGFPEELTKIMSCARDAAFAQAYSPKVIFTRETTLSEGGPCCAFRFKWAD